MVNISEIKEFSRKLRLLYLENPEVQRNIDAALVYLDLAVHAAEQSFAPEAAHADDEDEVPYGLSFHETDF